MELFIKIAFWMVTLCITFSGYPTVSSGIPIRKDDYNIELMREDVKCPNDSTFYGPKNIKPECFTEALICIQKELNGTVKEECDDPSGRIGEALDTLKHRIPPHLPNSPETKNSTDCACERWGEVSFSKFLERFESLLDQEMSVASG